MKCLLIDWGNEKSMHRVGKSEPSNVVADDGGEDDSDYISSRPRKYVTKYTQYERQKKKIVENKKIQLSLSLSGACFYLDIKIV